MVDGLQSSQSLTIQFPQQKQYLFNPENDFTNNILTRYKYVLFSVTINFSFFWK